MPQKLIAIEATGNHTKKIKMIKNYIIAEYSVSQKCFHVHDLKSMLNHNIENMVALGDSDWLPIGVFEEERQAHDYIAACREQMEKQKGSWVNDVIRKATKF